MSRRVLAAAVAVLTLLGGCTDGGELQLPGGLTLPGGPSLPDGVEIAEGWSVEVVRDDLERPTQLALDPDGSLHVAELAGGEDAGEGRVRLLDPVPQDAEVRPSVTDLLTPTGLQLPGDRVFLVQEQQTLVEVADGEREVLVEDLPFNGRSQGTLTLLPPADRSLGPDGYIEVLAVATGTGSGPDPAPGSGQLYAVVTDDTDEVAGAVERRSVAVGFKNAYAHAFGPDDELYVTEIGDGTYDGERPPDELNVIPADVWRAAVAGDGAPYDGGWPRCIGDGDPTEEFGASAAECADLPAPVATFPPRSTPTSVAVTADGRVLVALWVEGRVVEVDPTDGSVTDVVTGLDGPQHLLVRPGSDEVLLTVHGSGHLLALQPTQ